MTLLLWVLALIVIVAGLAGTVIPGLPGPILVFVGVLLAAWADEFARIGPATLVLLGVMTASAYAIDVVASAVGVRRSAASGRAAVGAALGALAGLFFGLPGLIIGPFVGAVVAELTVRRDLVGAGRAGVAAWIGFVVGAVLKLALVFVILGIAAAALLLG
jgi:uncharacterized protein YqgC (DUF456 family)